MSVHEVNTVAAAAAVRGWFAVGESAEAHRRRVAASCSHLWLDSGGTDHLFTAVTRSFGSAAEITTRTASAAEAADRWLSIVSATLGGRPGGDRGGSFSIEPRATYASFATSPTGRGRDLVGQALTDVGDRLRLGRDEFGIVRVADDRVVVVLPGVVDLSDPHLGWDPLHRSVRDLDQAAVPSSLDVGVESNPYAGMVVEALDRLDLPSGSEVMIIGHSFGAETAIDIAADPSANGGGAYRVTHVVAAGYAVEPMLSEVPADTDVLVLRNQRDVVATGEELAGIVSFERDDGGGLLAEVPVAGVPGDIVAGVAGGVARSASDRGDGLVDVAREVVTGDVAGVLDEADDLVGPDVGVRTTDTGAIVNVFDGGWSGAGHSEHHYVDAIQSSSDARVAGFLESVDAAGYTAGGTLLAVDVSVPVPAAGCSDAREVGHG